MAVELRARIGWMALLDRKSHGSLAERLDALTKDEMWDVCRALQPEIAREEYDALYDEFVRLKRAKELQ